MTDTSAPYSVTALVVVTLLVLLVISIATIVVAVLIWKRDRGIYAFYNRYKLRYV